MAIGRRGEIMTSGEMGGNWSTLYFRWLSQMMSERVNALLELCDRIYERGLPRTSNLEQPLSQTSHIFHKFINYFLTDW